MIKFVGMNVFFKIKSEDKYIRLLVYMYYSWKFSCGFSLNILCEIFNKWGFNM